MRVQRCACLTVYRVQLRVLLKMSDRLIKRSDIVLSGSDARPDKIFASKGIKGGRRVFAVAEQISKMKGGMKLSK